MRKFLTAFFWLALLVLVLVAIAAGAFWAWFFAPKTRTGITQRYGPFREAWRSDLAPAAAGPLTAGVAVMDITPPVGTPLGGYGARHGRPSTGVHDNLYAKALVLDNGSERLAIVTTDLIGVSKAVKQQVLRRASRAASIDSAHLLICASHTHSGPGALSPELAWQLAMGRYDASLRRSLVNRLAGVIISASHSLHPARVGWGVTTAPEFVADRRRQDPLQVTDPELTVVRVDGDDGAPIAVLVNYAAHGTCLGSDNMLVSADFPGYLQRGLEARIGAALRGAPEHGRAAPGAVVMFANGAQGDQAPHSPVAGGPPPGERGYAAAEDIGFGLADRAYEVWRRIEPRHDVKLAAVAFPTCLPEKLTALLSTTYTEIQAMSIAGLCVMAVPGEMTAPLGMQLKEQAQRLGFDGLEFATLRRSGPTRASWPCIFGLANDHIGYILTEDQYRRGGYERMVSGYGPELGQFMKTAMATAVMELAVRVSDIAAARAEDALGRRTCGPARAYHRRGQWVLELSGNPYEIGFRHGALVKPELTEALKRMRGMMRQERRTRFAGAPGGMSAMLFLARRPEYMLEQHVPPEYVLELHGLADGLGLDYDTTLFLQVMLAILEQPNPAKMLGLGRGTAAATFTPESTSARSPTCSNFAAFRVAARGGELVHGRNLDWGMGDVLPGIATVAFYHPNYGNSFVAVNWAGMVGCLTAMNAAGLSIGEESVSSPRDTSVDGDPLFLLVREAAQYSSSLDDAVQLLTTTPGTCGYHITICDGNRCDARTVEVTAHHHAVRLPQEGLLFGCVAERGAGAAGPQLFEGGALPHSDIARADSSSDSRYARLRELAAQSYGRIDAGLMQSFLRDNIDPRTGQPGASLNSVCNASTLHSVVMRPGRGDLWVAQGKMPAPTGEYVHYDLRQMLAGTR